MYMEEEGKQKQQGQAAPEGDPVLIFEECVVRTIPQVGKTTLSQAVVVVQPTPMGIVVTVLPFSREH
jgi:hypothetical protein